MPEIKLPALGESISSGTVINVAVKKGDVVKRGDKLLEIEAEKTTLDVPSHVEGKITEVYVKVNDEIKIGDTLFAYEEHKGAHEVREERKEGLEDSAHKRDERGQSAGVVSQKLEVRGQESEVRGQRTEVRGQRTEVHEEEIPIRYVSSLPLEDIPAAPSVRRLAREIGVNISEVKPSGPHGRVTEDDVKKYSRYLHSQRGAARSGFVEEEPLPDFSKWGEVEIKPMSQIRKKTMKHMWWAWSAIPHVTQFNKADLTKAQELFKKHSTAQRKINITHFIIKLSAEALKEFPNFNVSGDTAKNEIVYKKYFHIGVAVDTKTGLIVPVIRDVDKKTVYEISDDLNELAKKARNKKISLEELKGASFTVSSLGKKGGTGFTPIINWPEVAIIGISSILIEPVYDGEKFVPHEVVTLSLSYDHRFIDGVDGAKFLDWIVSRIEEPSPEWFK